MNDKKTSKPVVDVTGIDSDEVADLLEAVAKEIRKAEEQSPSTDKDELFKRVNSGALFDFVHRT